MEVDVEILRAAEALDQRHGAGILGVDRNVYAEPAIWTIESARDFYGYTVTRPN